MEETIRSEIKIPLFLPMSRKCTINPKTPLFLKFSNPSSCMVDLVLGFLLVDVGKPGNVRI
jgi:hypothetical protein